MKHILLFHFFTASFLSIAQNIPIGQWRIHSPYNSSITLAVSANQVYSSSGPGIFYLDKEDNSINPLSKITGLNDINASRIKTDTNTGTTLIAYSDGNVDVLKNGAVANVSDILTSQILSSKTPNDIHFYKGYAYLCYPFGISVLDPVKNQIKESYLNLSPKSTLNPIFSCATSSGSAVDSIYAATRNGILGAVISSSVNLLDYASWHAFTAAEGTADTAVFVSVESYNGHMYALSRNKLYVYNGSSWDTLSLPIKLNRQGKNLENSHGQLVITSQSQIIAYNGSSFSIISPLPSYANFVDAAYDKQGTLWIADSINGLLSKQGNGYVIPYVPNGPFTPSSFRLSEYNGTVIGVPGGYQSDYAYLHVGTIGGYYSFYDGTWSNYNIYTPGFPWCTDIVSADYNPVDGNLYFASYSEGLVIKKPDGSFTLSNSSSTPSAPFIDLCPPSCCYCTFIIDIDHDSQGNEWGIVGLTSFNTPCLYSRTPGGVWSNAVTFGTAASQYPVILLIDDNDYKWISFRVGTGAPLIVYDKASKWISLQAGVGLGNLPSSNIYSMAKDKNGAIWVGTDNGIAIFENPSLFFNGGSKDAIIPIYNQFPLMFQQQVNTIKVDGGNRKWVGTSQGGAWLFSADGTQALLNFTASNSPLLSNNILDIAVNSVTGEVFFATDQGLISYRGTATEADSSYSKVKVFPNPVPHSYDGTIGISGLTENADVKITDIYGNLVYETHAAGGTAVWNGRNYKGKAADTGVYLIFSSLDDGSVAMVSKFAVVE